MECRFFMGNRRIGCGSSRHLLHGPKRVPVLAVLEAARKTPNGIGNPPPRGRQVEFYVLKSALGPEVDEACDGMLLC